MRRYDNTIGWHLRLIAARESAGISKAALAKRLGVSGATLTGWEAGAVVDPHGSHLLRLAEALDMAPAALLFGAPEPAAVRDATARYRLGPDDAEVVRLYRRLTQRQRSAVMAELVRLEGENQEVLRELGGGEVDDGA